MTRSNPLAVLALAAALIASPALAYTEAEISAWARTAVVLNGDQVTAVTEQGVSIIRSGTRRALANGNVVISTRFEYRDPVRLGSGYAYRSLAQTYQFDCRARQFQVTERVAFAENNLRGATREDRRVQPPWETFNAGTALEAIYERACGSAGVGAKG